ncbi:diacylglycerol/lipid kinase family protein [Streptomyces sp. NPDC020681]|uniref:diacylglycerol/lipid kinase family protein n=1 Tax=Streptomyces sp. NPDC020681 TaxID=3365083 RepID=UPI00378BBB0D
MDTDTVGGGHGSAAQRWAARSALAAGAAALVVLLVSAGLRSIALVALWVGGLAVGAAGVWWALSRRGLVRAIGFTLAAAAPAVVLALCVVAGLLWEMLVSAALWALAVWVGRIALRGDGKPSRTQESSTTPPVRAFLIMNPRSGGGKVVRFGLKEKAEALGADVLLLPADHQEDVVELARRAVADGADLLGVAGGDGTQALVAGVAAEHGVPFMVIPAGTRNHFALDLGLDREDPSTSLDALTDGVELRIDLGFVGDRAFVNNASFGAYAAVVQSPAYRDDKIRIIMQMLPDLLTHQAGPRLVVHAGDVTIDEPQGVLVSNNPYRVDDLVGLGRRDRLDSGFLGVLGIQVDNAAQAAGMLRGKNASGLTVLTTHELVVDADEPEVQVGVDGEALTLPTPVRCGIRPRALRVRVPRNRPGLPLSKPPMDWRRLRTLALTMGRVAVGTGAGSKGAGR